MCENIKKTVYEIDVERGWKICSGCSEKKELKHFLLKKTKGEKDRYITICYKCDAHDIRSKNPKITKYITKDNKIHKHCKKCNNYKELTQFNKSKNSKYGVGVFCRECNKHIQSEYRKNKTPYCQTKIGKLLYANRRKTIKHKQYMANYMRNRTQNDLNFKIKINLRGRIYKALRFEHKSAHTTELLGCSVEEFIKYIESKWTNGMSWENHTHTGWHIDHIIPCNTFDLSKPEEQRKCFHYTNLQPLWATKEVAMKYGENENYVGNLNKTKL